MTTFGVDRFVNETHITGLMETGPPLHGETNIINWSLTFTRGSNELHITSLEGTLESSRLISYPEYLVFDQRVDFSRFVLRDAQGTEIWRLNVCPFPFEPFVCGEIAYGSSVGHSTLHAVQTIATLVPEPASGLLTAFGLIVAGIIRRSRHGRTRA